jgi:hypothetical protein
MDLVERYLQAVGKLLPVAQRADILSELRSSLYDTLENEHDQPVSESEVVALLKRTGSPQEVAAAYYPNGQYLIGPQLYPLFLMVARIALVVIFITQIIFSAFHLIDSLSIKAIINSIVDIATTMAFGLGFLVAIFWAMQRLEVKPEAEVFNPLDLPELAPEAETVSYSSQVGAILTDVLVLAVLGRFIQEGNLAWIDGSVVENPVLMPFIPFLITLSVAGIILNIFVMWQQEWSLRTRLAEFALNLVSLVAVVIVLVQHDQWLIAQGAASLFENLNLVPTLLIRDDPLAGVAFFRIVFAFATIVIAAETLASGLQVARSWSRQKVGLPAEHIALGKG